MNARMRGAGRILQTTFSVLIASLALSLLPSCSSLPQVGRAPAVEANSVPEKPTVIPARRVGNLLLIEVQWDKRGPWRFVVDTGSSVTLVSSEFASRYAVSAKRFVNAPKRVRLSTGSEKLFPNTVIQEMRLGGAVFSNKPVLVFDPTELSAHFGVKVDGILGFPFFGDCTLELDYAQPQLRISRVNTNGSIPAGATPYVLDTRTPRISSSIAGYERSLLIDSGSDSALVLPAPVPEMNFSVPPRPGGALGSLAGITYSQVGRLAGDLRFADQVIPGPVVTFGGTESLLGGELLSQFTVTFDTAARWVRFTVSGHPLAPAPLRHCGMSFTKAPAYWRVDAVVPGSAAEQAGVRTGDLIVRINGEAVSKWPLARFDAHVRKSNELIYTFLHGTRERPIVLAPVDLVP